MLSLEATESKVSPCTPAWCLPHHENFPLSPHPRLVPFPSFLSMNISRNFSRVSNFSTSSQHLPLEQKRWHKEGEGIIFLSLWEWGARRKERFCPRGCKYNCSFHAHFKGEVMQTRVQGKGRLWNQKTESEVQIHYKSAWICLGFRFWAWKFVHYLLTTRLLLGSHDVLCMKILCKLLFPYSHF